MPEIALDLYWSVFINDEEDLNYSVFLNDGTFIGRVALQGINKEYPELAIILIREYQGQGLGYKLLVQWLNWVYESLGYKRIIVKVVYHVKAGMVEEFREKLTEANIEATVKKEDGCEEYYYTSHPENDTIVLTERWASKEAQQEHLTKTHMKIVKALKEEYVISTEVTEKTECTFEEE